MSFTCPVESSLPLNKLSETFPGDKNVLPSSILPTDRAEDGLLKSSVISDWISRLEGSGIIPSIKSSNPSTYTTKVTALLLSAKQEYCFYDSRYRASLDYLFSSIRSSSTSNTEEAQRLTTVRLQTVQVLNRKVNDLIQIMNAITDKMMKSSTTLQDEIEEFKRNLKLKRDRLEQQNQLIQSNEASMRLEKEMVKYSEEKARYSDNLLKMYSFLNIVALGLLVYVYKAAGDE